MVDQRAGRQWPKTFADRLTASVPGPLDVVRMLRDCRRMDAGGGSRKRLRAAAAKIPVARRTGLPRAEPGQTVITWVGHASFVIQAGGLTVLTDPVWSRHIPGTVARLTPPGLAWGALPHVDAVVISHNHFDHLDAPTVRRLPLDTPVLVPAKLARWFERRGFSEVTELDWWESRSVGGVTFDFVPSHHWSRRTVTDTCKTLWGGWVVTTPGARIYFAGDTAYGDRFAQIGAHYPDIDLALMPVGAYEPGWFMRRMHVSPEEAVQATIDVGATRMAPMHWGTFILSAEPLTEPVERAAQAWAASGRPRDDLWDLAIGATRSL